MADKDATEDLRVVPVSVSVGDKELQCDVQAVVVGGKIVGWKK